MIPMGVREPIGLGPRVMVSPTAWHPTMMG